METSLFNTPSRRPRRRPESEREYLERAARLELHEEVLQRQAARRAELRRITHFTPRTRRRHSARH